MPAPASSPCTCFLLRRAARQASQIYDRELAPAGLNLNQYSTLKRAAGGPHALGELADVLGMDRTTLTRNLRPLLDAGWLREGRGSEDARRRVVEITADGRARLALARPCWRRAQKHVEARFGAAATARLHADLDRLQARLSSAIAK